MILNIAKMTITIVTGFFDLPKRGLGLSKSLDVYFEKAEKLMQVPCPMIIYCDPELVERILNMRSKYNLESKTLCVGCAFEDLEYYIQYFQMATSALRINPLLNGNAQKDTPAYFVLNWSKITLLQKSIESNPFSSTHFLWIDFGVCHVAKTSETTFTDILSFQFDKIRCLCMKHVCKTELQNMQLYYSYRWGKIAGGVFGGSREYLTQLITKYDYKLETLLKQNFAIMDEQIFSLLMHESPEIFDVYYGDYEYVLENFCYIKGNFETIINNIQWCKERHEYDLVLDVCSKVLLSQYVSPLQKIKVYIELYSMFWITDTKKCLSILQELKSRSLADSVFFSSLQEQYPKISSMISPIIALTNKKLVGMIMSACDVSTLSIPNEVLTKYQFLIFLTDYQFTLDSIPPANPFICNISEKIKYNSLPFISKISEISSIK